MAMGVAAKGGLSGAGDFAWILRPELVQQHGKPRPCLGQAFPDDRRRHIVVRFDQVLVQLQHPRGDVIVIRAGRDCLWSFHGDTYRQFAVHIFRGQLIAFPGPRIDVRRTFLPAGHLASE